MASVFLLNLGYFYNIEWSFMNLSETLSEILGHFPFGLCFPLSFLDITEVDEYQLHILANS